MGRAPTTDARRQRKRGRLPVTVHIMGHKRGAGEASDPTDTKRGDDETRRRHAGYLLGEHSEAIQAAPQMMGKVIRRLH